MKDRILIFGATGYLGSRLVAALKSDGYIVTCIGKNENNDIIVDLSDFELVANIKLKYKYKAIFHLAAINETLIQSNIKMAYDVNVVATRAIVELAKRNGIKYISYCSTFHVIGQTTGQIVPHVLLKPKNDYGLTHLLSEQILESLCPNEGIQVNIVRPTNIYGVPLSIKSFDRWSLIPFSFVRQAVTKGKILLKTNGNQQRNFVDINNVIASLMFFGSRKVNVIGYNTLSIRDFALLVSKRLSSKYGEVEVILPEPEAEEKIIFEPKLEFLGDNNILENSPDNLNLYIDEFAFKIEGYNE
ncbi:NAD-dependent epimerase/dehydratase family protein [Yersinia mollaretii]|uniref:NAD-dependent epimerase/dehydratase family protein n=1 Tax=Yersinia mollaretii TaxID=33060 RepID=UPI0011AA3C8E|nr:NAD(P)-dependent oxidoreductase [Yersinia mollaretii]